MKISKYENNNKVTLAVSGTIDTTTATEFNKSLLELDYSNLDLTVDFTDVDYITSVGLRALLIARKKLDDSRMRVIGVSKEVAEVFEITGFSSMINIVLKCENPDNSENMSFKALLNNSFENAPEKIAYIYKNKEYTVGDIEKASQIIAFDLAKKGVKKGSHVGICAQNSINWIFTFFAVQKLGAIAVLFNFALMENEIISLAEIGDVTHLCYGEICETEKFNEFVGVATANSNTIEHIYNICPNIDFSQRFSEYDSIKDEFSQNYNADDASVIIYTSGSTGKPKAVLLSSYNLISSMNSLIGEFKINAQDRNCAFLPLFHVFGFSTCIVVGLLTGMVSYIPENSKPDTLLDLIEKNKCTLFHSVPTMMLAMAQRPSFSSNRVESVRLSALGGSATTETQMMYLMQIFKNNHFCNVYGMSENAAISITQYVDTVEHITKTVGKPLENIEIQIRDTATNKVLPNGMPGEIFIRSDTMIVCYYKLPIEKQPLDDEGWLATGDLGILSDDGYLRLVGRVKDLIIRGGENISPGEVAEAISKYEDVADVKVIGVPHEVFGEEVAAAVIMNSDASFDEDKMRNYLSDKLAKYKIPSYFVVFEKFPLLGSGKVDATQLKKIIIEQISDKQQKLCDI